MTWEYIFMGMGMKTGTGMGMGTYSLFTPSSTSVDTNKPDQDIKKKDRFTQQNCWMSAAAVTCLQVFALHVRLAVGRLGQRERLAEHCLVLDVSHQTSASIRHGTLVHQLKFTRGTDINEMYRFDSI